MTRAMALVVAVGLVGASRPALAGPATADVAAKAPAERRQLAVSLSLRAFDRVLTVDAGGDEMSERDTLWRPVGVWGAYRWWYGVGDGRSGLRGEASVGLELLAHAGSLPLTAAHTTAWVWSPGGRWSAWAGARVGVSLDVPDADYPQAELGASLGVGWRRLELSLQPGMTIGLGSDTRAIGDGQLRRGAATALAPVQVLLGWRLD